MNQQSSKKIYGIPLSVAHRVKEEVDNSNDRVVLIVLERMAVKAQQLEYREEYGVNEDWHKHYVPGLHSRGCGCLYCETLHRYVVTKVSAHRLGRRLDNYDYTCRPYDNPTGYTHLKQLNTEWVRLKKLKDQIKALTGL
jgi:hypothetical protein